MSKLDWVIECNEKNLNTCEIICEILHHAYEEPGQNAALQVWLKEIKPKLGSPRFKLIRQALDKRIWEDLC